MKLKMPLLKDKNTWLERLFHFNLLFRRYQDHLQSDSIKKLYVCMHQFVPVKANSCAHWFQQLVNLNAHSTVATTLSNGKPCGTRIQGFGEGGIKILFIIVANLNVDNFFLLHHTPLQSKFTEYSTSNFHVRYAC